MSIKFRSLWDYKKIFASTGVVLFAVILVSILAGNASAAVVTLQASKDNSMYGEDLTYSNGAGDYFFTGRTKNSALRRGLLAFNLVGQIPVGSTINSVTLTLYKSRGKGSAKDVSLHLVQAEWGEGTSHAGGEEGEGTDATTNDATWSHRLWPSTTWTSLGGDYLGTASATTGVGGTGFYTWSTASMASDVQFWLDNPGSNFGWILIGEEDSDLTARRFDSRTNGTVSQRPTLEIDYTSPIVTGACCLPGDSCAVLSEADCLTQSGVYQGDSTLCTPDPCVIPTGACCFDDGTCSELSAADCAAQSGSYQGDGTACVPDLCPLVLTPFLDPLPIPQPATPTSGTIGGVATYDIAMTQFKQKLHSELDSTTVWGYAGAYPGPTIEAGTGLPVTVNWINDLRDSLGNLRTDHYLPVDLCMHGPDSLGPTARTVVHLHGGHVPPEVDGYPEATFLPGEQVTYVYPNNQPAATLWYHDHALGITRLNVIMGLAGFYLVRDAAEAALNLPSGEYEIPIVIQDRTFNSDGTFKYPADWQNHFFGDKILVNGKVWPYLNVKQGKYRFRILNGSNSRVYRLTTSPPVPFEVIGNDGGLLPEPVQRDTLLISGGERFDLVMDFSGFSAATEILLTNDAPAPYPGSPGIDVIPNVMKFIVQGTPGFTDALPESLSTITKLDTLNADQFRFFELEKVSDACAGSIWLINGLHWNDITEKPFLGDTEVWSFANKTGVVHPMHMHLVFFQIIDRQQFVLVNDTIVPTGPQVPPDSASSGWKDTVPVGPNEIVRVIAKFEDYTGKYPYHCHILEHEDHEMMRQFEVVDDVSDITGVPASRYDLSPVYPNPFNPNTSIAFELPVRERVTIRIYDVTGRRLRTLVNGVRSEGRHTVMWDGRNQSGGEVASGIYFVEMKTSQFRSVRKAVFLK
jgi:spore coat protein A